MPHPLGPIRDTNCSSRTSREIGRKASVAPCLDSYVNDTSRAAIRISPEDAATSCAINDDSCVNKSSIDRHCNTSFEACSSLDRGQRLQEHYSPATRRAPCGLGSSGREPNCKRCSSSPNLPLASALRLAFPRGATPPPPDGPPGPGAHGRWFAHQRQCDTATMRLSADQWTDVQPCERSVPSTTNSWRWQG